MTRVTSTPTVWSVISEGFRTLWNLNGLRTVGFAGLVWVGGSTAVAIDGYDPALAKQAGAPFVGGGQAQTETTVGGPETLYGSDVTDENLLIIDKLTAGFVIVGPVGTPIAAGLAFDPATGLLFATDTLTKNLVTIDPADGTTTVIGDTGISLPHGLAIDPDDGTLYAANSAGLSSLWVIDKNTGDGEFIGSIGFPDIGALDFEPATGILYGASGGPTNSGQLITIDTDTGLGTLIGSTHRINGLAFDNDGALYASENGLFAGAPSGLYLIDKETGDWQSIGTIDADNVLGIDFTVEIPSVPVFSYGGSFALALLLPAAVAAVMLWRRRSTVWAQHGPAGQ